MPRKGVLVESVLPILSAMGLGISYNTILFTKLIRICGAFLESHCTSVCGVPEVQLNDKENTTPPGSSGRDRSTTSTLTRDSSPVKK